jgi:hypothetical protein
MKNLLSKKAEISQQQLWDIANKHEDIFKHIFQGKLNFITPETTHNKLIPILDNIFTHKTTGALAGAGLGAGAGLLLGQKNKKLRSGLLGGLVGGGAGYGLSSAFPEQSKEINEKFIDSVIRKPVGRVLTNVWAPRTYTGEQQAGDLVRHTPKELYEAILKDKPAYGVDHREPLWRRSFGLEPRQYTDTYLPNGKDTWQFNPKDNFVKENIVPDIAQSTYEKHLGNASNMYERHVMHAFQGNYDPSTNKASYYDPWDFNLHKNESLNSIPHALRFILDKLIKKQTMKGEIEMPDYLKARYSG